MSDRPTARIVGELRDLQMAFNQHSDAVLCAKLLLMIESRRCELRHRKRSDGR
jgi:hypothetical protein